LIAAARRGVDRGARITDALLAFSRRQMLQPQAIDVNQLIGGFAELLQQTAGDAVEMRLALRAMTPWCRIDPAPFQTALLNLVANARDAMLPHGGSIVIETEDARLDACDPEAAYDHIALTVRDEGAGMSPDTLERAFEPFFTTKDIETASGLGLSQVFGFVKQSGGQIQLMSKPGIGTAVRLYLPRDARGTSGPDDGDAAAPQPARPTGKDEPVAVLGGRSASPSTERCCATG
jgi:signal transduction histidine kinase